MSTLLLDINAVNNLMNMPDVINVVEEAFRIWGEGKGNMPAKAYLLVEYGDELDRFQSESANIFILNARINIIQKITVLFVFISIILF